VAASLPANTLQGCPNADVRGRVDDQVEGCRVDVRIEDPLATIGAQTWDG
jgi:hypothetical protein